MSEQEAIALLKTYKELVAIGAVEVRINHEQVLKITVAELISKYKAAKERKDTETSNDFSKVLRFYLDDEEFNLIDATGQPTALLKGEE